MGVQGLWELLAPVGRRVSVETLAGKKLAIDASIWMVQFMKAMRDEKGDMVRNAHVLGFFRRICKLLFLRTKPVFVFDGGTPALKRRTVLARRRQRENAQSKIRKTAEKLLLNHLKSMRLKELAQEIENQRKMNDKKGKKVVTENAEMKDSDCKSDDDDHTKGKSVVPEDVEASDVVSKSDNVDRKGKKVLVDDDDEVKDTSWKSDDEVDKVYDQEALDAMLAASLAAEEDGNYTGNLSTSVGNGCASADDDGDEDEEMILPVMNGKVDPAVLAVLPPSMQLDLLVQMRERLMAENRQKYQKVKKAPEKFSQLQIQSYLKTVAFRREIDEVQKSASGRGVAGVQTSRIASEANREYIFSSSFTGDKQTLMAGGVEKNGFTENRTTVKTHIPSDSVHRFSSIAPSPSATGSGVDEPITGDDDVETYLDERGRVRVSRVRAMGMRMTRDLQRNLDLMKEMEHEKMKENSTTHAEAIFNKIVLGVDTHIQASDEGIDEVSSLVEGINMPIEDKTLQVPGNITGMEISFFEDERGNESNDDDDLFAHLVAGSSVTLSPVKIDPSGNHSPHAASDCSWEEGIVEEKSSRFTNDVEEESLPTLLKENTNGENEVEWEEGDCDVIGSRSPYPSIHTEAIAKSSLEEEADIQEAIRRSLENFTNEECSMSIEKEKLKNSEMAKQNLVVHVSSNGDTVDSLNFPVENSLLQSPTPREVVGFNKPGYTGEENSISVNKSSGRQLASVVLETKISAKSSEVQKPSERSPDPCVGILSDTTSEFSITGIERPSRDPLSRVEQKEVQLVTNARLDKETIEDISANSCEERVHVCEDRVHVSPVQMDEVVQPNLSNAQVNNSQKFPMSQTKPNLVDSHSYKTIETTSSVEESSWKEIPTSVDIERDLVAKENSGLYGEEIRHIIDNSTTQTNVEVPMELSGAHIDEELLHLRQERADLGDEQRKLERNAESVSSEMFAECQELLQMFGVPYIIAPMEAEAQCAYMELANLVDGVVTDDSDVFLFGARNVYKNIFDDRKYVETYFMKDIESDLGLTREQLIRMALLLGSDYTEGVSGIGIVNAIEVVNAFPEEDGLQKFREWIESPDPSILGKIGSQSGSGSRRKGSKGFNNHIDCSKQSVDEGSGISENVSEGHDDDQSIVNIQNVKQTFMEKHRNVSKNWHIPSSFPSETVVSAYVSPQVDQSTDPFSWGKPDLLVLRKLCWEKFGWSNQKADELLVPVLKEYSKHETQLRLEAFYTFNERFAKIRSRRIKKAVKGIAGKRSLDLMDGVPQERANSRKARRVSSSEPQGNNENPSNPQKDSIAESNAPELSTVKQSRRKKKDRVPVPSEVHAETPIETRNVQDSNRGSSGNAKGRGRGRGRVSGRGRGKELSGCKLIDTSSDQDSDHNDNLETQVGNSEKTCTVRRSTRSRKRLDYTEDDLGADGLRKSLDQNDRTCMGDMLEQEPLNVLSDADDDLNKKESAPSLEEQDEKDYLEVGGGFCFDEGEDNHSDHLAQCPDSENVNHSFDTEFSAEYLKMGGGFCVEEEGAESVEEEGDELSTGAGMNAPAITQSPPSSIKDSNGQTTTASVSPVLDEPQKVDSTPTGLSAMPFLRRKRRKT